MPAEPRLERTTSRAAALVALVGLAWGAGGGVTPAAGATTTPPDLKILVPVNLISIGLDATSGHRMLRYTHITEDAGTGPFELDPTYDPATGIASFVQTIYGSASPGAWTVDHTVPIAVNGAFVNGSDYRFPLTKFTLNTVNADGSVGAPVATSPKTEYCMTGDNRVGDVPNTPTQTTPPVSNCNDPTLPLGWSVGWGDQYDQTDSGQPIDLSAVANGTYVLRATVDPQHVLSESDATNNVTDTRLTITGTTVMVGAQTHPTITPPAVAVTNPLSGSTVSGTVTLSATASASSPATVTSVQYVLDGNPLGGLQTTAPYGYAWTVGSTPPGAHRLSAQVTDSAGDVSTAPVVSVNVPPSGGGGGSTQTIIQNGHGTTVTAPFSTPSGQTLVALVGSDGPATASGQSVTVSGAGLSWKRIIASNSQYGDSEIWEATTSNALSSATVTSTPSVSNYDQQLTVLVIGGTAGVGASARASAPTGGPAVTLTTTAAGSSSYAVGNDWDTATGRTVGSGQAIVSQWADSTSGDTFWAQRVSAASASAGQGITLTDSAPTADRWNLVAVEVLPSGSSPPPPDTTPPTATITNPATGQTVSGTTTVAATASDNIAVSSVQFLLDGQPLGGAVTTTPYAIAWDTTKASAGSHTLTATAVDSSGNVGTSAMVTVTVQNPAPPMTCFVLQAQRSVHGTSTVTTPTFNTAMAGEVLVAFVASDGPATAGGQSAIVSGAALSWTLVKRANAQYGDSEIWTATAPTILTNASVTSKPAKAGYHEDLTVIAMEGASGVGAAVAGSATTGAAGVSLTTTMGTSLVFAVGNDWDQAVARTLPTGFVPLDQWVDVGVGDTSWSEYTNQTTGAAGSVVKIGTTAPATDRWNLVAVELKNGG